MLHKVRLLSGRIGRAYGVLPALRREEIHGSTLGSVDPVVGRSDHRIHSDGTSPCGPERRSGWELRRRGGQSGRRSLVPASDGDDTAGFHCPDDGLTPIS